MPVHQSRNSEAEALRGRLSRLYRTRGKKTDGGSNDCREEASGHVAKSTSADLTRLAAGGGS